MRVLVWCSAALLALAGLGQAAWGQGEPAAMAQEVQELRARLEALEAQLAEVRSGQEAVGRDLRRKMDAPGVKASGYVQSQYSVDRAISPGQDFRVRRARLKLDAAVSDLSALTLQLDAAREVELKDAYVDLGRRSDPWRFRMGQAKVPFSYEVLESSGNRLEPERTALMGALFPGERDVGAFLHLKSLSGRDSPPVTLDLAVFSGNGPSKADNNDEKDVAVRLRTPVGSRPPDPTTEADSVYVGYLRGRHTSAGQTTDRDYLGGGISKVLGPVWLRAEAIGGKHRGREVFGWYARAAYRIPDHPGTVFARYERFDEDRNTDGTDFRNLTVGYEQQLDSKTRVVVAHEFRRPGPSYSRADKTEGDLTTLRVQVKY